ncbi:hypothetical protein FDP41_011194 [Naegleria fowleri]|uniref:Exportin-1/Importin-beta-like domain-containing protein n=1 Tax=Naegleria fowleri TaxID=5763 RepID=A0A6A5C6Z3_NAEFO|nr:uncharacterized protein FDP41_011194 [Naegleria fowleri]KAF0982264.1 hypothetical protein FDP41_011194 [Naegleria fowleri]
MEHSSSPLLGFQEGPIDPATGTSLSLEKLQSLLDLYYSGTLYISTPGMTQQNQQQQTNIETMLQRSFGSDRDCWKKGLLLLMSSASSINASSLQHVQWFALTLLEESVHHVEYWQNQMTLEERQQVENVLMTNILPNFRHFATPIWRKACKVVVEIAKMEWPQNWPNLLPQIFQIGNNSETAVVALTILQMLSEEISNMSGESKQDKDDIPEDRKESLYNSMLIVVDDLLRFLESILSSLYPGYYGTVLRAFIENNSQLLEQLFQQFKSVSEITISSLDCLTHVLSWVSPIEKYLLSHSTLFSNIVQYSSLYFNIHNCTSSLEKAKENIENVVSDISIKALNCFNEIISKPMRSTGLGQQNAQLLGTLMNTMYSTMLQLLQNYINLFNINDISKKENLVDKFSQGQHEEFVHKMNLILQGFSENHLSRILLCESPENVSAELAWLGLNFPVTTFIEILFSYTTLQFTTDNYQTAITIWNQFLDSMMNSFDDLTSYTHFEFFKRALLSLVDDVLRRTNFRDMKNYFNTKLSANIDLEYLNELDDEKKDVHDSTELDNYLEICIDVVGNIAELFPNETVQLIIEKFNILVDVEFTQNLFGKLLPSKIQQQQLLSSEEVDYMRTVCKDVRSALITLTRLSNVMVCHFETMFSISTTVISKVLTIQNMGIRNIFSDNNSQLALLLKSSHPHSSTLGLFRLTGETFSFLQQYTRWIFLFGSSISKGILEAFSKQNSSHNVSSDLAEMQNQYVVLVTSIIENIAQSLVLSSSATNFIIPYEIVSSAVSLLLLMTSALSQLDYTLQTPPSWNAIAYKHITSTSIEEIKSFNEVIIPNMHTMLSSLSARYPPLLENAENIISKLYVSVSVSILNRIRIIPLTVKNMDTKKAQTVVYEMYNNLLGSQLITPFEQAIQMLNTQHNSELVQFISLLFKISQSVLRNIKHQPKQCKQVGFEVMKKVTAPDLIVNLMNFTLNHSTDKTHLALLEVIIDLQINLFDDWKAEVGHEYINGIINTFMDIMTRSSSMSLFMKEPIGRNVLTQFLKLLKALVSDGSGKYAGTIGKIIYISRNLLYPELKNVGEGKLSGNVGAIEVLPYYYDMLYGILHYNWKHFFSAQMINNEFQEMQCTSNEAFEEFCFIMECFLNSFFSTDITIFKTNLAHLESLNDHHKFYERPIFKQRIPSLGNLSIMDSFMNAFLNILIAKSHSLYKNDLLLTIFNMVNAGNWNHFANYIQEFLSSDNKLVQKLTNEQKQQLLVRLVMKLDSYDEHDWKSFQNFSRRLSQFTNDLSYSVKQNTRSGLSFLTMI